MLIFCYFLVILPSEESELGDMSQKKNPLVFLDVSIDGDPVERIVIEVTAKTETYSYVRSEIFLTISFM